MLVEGLDYYWEDGFMVFTAHYHLSRGSCCKNKCRHCPWKFGVKQRKEADDDES